MKTMTIGLVTKYDKASQTCSLQLIDNAPISTTDTNYRPTKPVELHGIKVQFLRIGGFALTCDVNIGDACVVLFSHRGIQHWIREGRKEYKYTKGRPEPDAKKKWNPEDAVAIPGLSSNQNPLSDPSQGLSLRNEENDQSITLFPDKSIIIDTVGEIRLKAGGNVNIEAGGNVEVKGSLIKLNS